MRNVLAMLDIAPPLEQPESRVKRDIFGGGGGETVSTNTIQQSDPWAGVQPYLQDIFSRGQGLANRGAYGGPYLGSQSSATQNALSMGEQRAYAGSPLTRAAQDQNLATVRGDYLDLSKNPAVKSAMDSARTQVNSQFTGDNYGNSAHQEWLNKGLLSAAAPFYQQERGFQQQAIAQAPAMAEQDYADIAKLASIGAARDSRSQAEVDAQRTAYNAPWDNLFNYQRSIAGSGATGGTTSTSGQTPMYSNPLASGLGLASGGLGLYNGLTSAGLLGGAGAGLGALGTAAGMDALGLLVPAFSDRRLKQNIERIGTHEAGFGIYRYNYIWSDEPTIGVMADEVEMVNPEAVRRVDGYAMVDYAKLH